MLKKQEKTEKELKEKEEQKKSIADEILKNEKEQLRLELARMEEGKMSNEASDDSLTPDPAPEARQQVDDDDDETRQNDLTEVAYV